MILRKRLWSIEVRITVFMARLRRIVPKLEDGVELVAEGSNDTGERADSKTLAGPGNIGPAWLEAFESIKAGLSSALEAYKKGDAGKAATLVNHTLSDHYNNGLLEVAIRSNISQRKNFEYNSKFFDIEGMITSGKDEASVEAAMTGLVDELRKDLPGLPLVEGAVSKRVVPK